MTTEQVVGCAPFRLQAPRALTPYEWTVVRGALLGGFGRAGRFALPDTPAAVTALLGAIANAVQCPAWRSSSFGPAPAVALLPYECVGEWFASLDYATRLRALADIQNTALLCSPNPPWQACGSDQRRIASSWEGAPQVGVFIPGAPVETCAEPRMRTAYVPMTLDELMRMFNVLGGQVPPILAQGYASLPPAARQRTVLLGVQLKPATADLPGILGGSSNPIVLAQGLVEEVAIVWAPGKGSSLTGLLNGNVDPRLLLELATAMMPELLGGGFQLPAIPGLPDLTTILGALGGILGTSRLVASSKGLHGFDARGWSGFGGGPAPTSGATGVEVVDTPGDQLDRSAPIPGLAVTETAFSPIKAAVVAGVVALGVWAIWKYAA